MKCLAGKLLLLLICGGCLLAFAKLSPGLLGVLTIITPETCGGYVNDALAANNTARALKIARYAARLYPLDPRTHTQCGRALLAAGDMEAARTAFHAALDISTTPAPEYRLTRKPFFHAPARLALGRLALEEGDILEAAHHCEAAAAFADLTAREYDDYHPDLYRIFSSLGFWGRALRFGIPGPEAIAVMDADSALNCARAVEQAGKWEAAGMLADRLKASAPENGYGWYLAGRVHAEAGDMAAAAADFLEGGRRGYGGAWWRLGETRQRQERKAAAIRAFPKTPSGSLYYPFALASAAALSAPAAPESLKMKLKEALKKAPAIRISLPEDPGRALFRPESISFAEENGRHSGIRLARLRWHIRGANPWADQPLPRVISSGRGGLLLIMEKDVYQLELIGNLLPGGTFEQVPAHSELAPGFLVSRQAAGPLRLDFIRREENTMVQIASDDPGNSLQLYSMPVAAACDAWYIAAGRVRTQEGRAHFGCRRFGEDERPHDSRDIIHNRAAPAWIAPAAAEHICLPGEYLTVYGGLYRQTGVVWLDGFMLLRVFPPA
jgi:tetratricopeptide (TPR) repeat protein